MGERTSVVEMFAEFTVPVASRGDVEVALDFVAVQTAEDAARVAHPPQARRLGELLPLLGCAQLVVHIPHVLPPGDGVRALTQSMRALAVLREVGGILPEQVSRQCPVACRILHVDVEVRALHCDDDIDVYLHVVGDALLYGEGLRGLAGPPSRYLGPGKVDACAEEEDGPRGGVAALGEVRLLCLGYEVLSVPVAS